MLPSLSTVAPAANALPLAGLALPHAYVPKWSKLAVYRPYPETVGPPKSTKPCRVPETMTLPDASVASAPTPAVCIASSPLLHAWLPLAPASLATKPVCAVS